MNFRPLRCLALAILWLPLLTTAAQLPDCMLNFQFGSQQYVLVVEKVSQKLLVYSNYAESPVETFRITTGKINGQKNEEGDLKTPEGIYFFTDMLSASELPRNDDYGEKAFTMNYPNPSDRITHRQGSGIWLHGSYDRSKTSIPNNSKGCVVLQNGDINRIAKYIFLKQTPICIYHRIRFSAAETLKKEREEFLGQLKTWKESWESKDTDRYIAFYHPQFAFSGGNLSSFRRYKENINSQYRFIRLFLTTVRLYAFANTRVALFNQLYISDVNNFYASKIQYWAQVNGKFQILAEDSQPLSSLKQFEISPGNVVTIDSFRRSLLQNRTPANVAPAAVYAPTIISLQKSEWLGKQLRLHIQSKTVTPPRRVIPVFSIIRDGGQLYRSLSGITLREGMPQDFSQALTLADEVSQIALNVEAGETVRSVTLFVLGQKNEINQILTYFLQR